MKKIICVLILCVLNPFGTKSRLMANTKSLNDYVQTAIPITTMEKEDIEALKDFVRTKGTITLSGNYQFDFEDNDNNHHIFFLKKDGTVKVWFFLKNIRDKSHLSKYIIKQTIKKIPDARKRFILSPVISKGLDEFIDKIKPQKVAEQYKEEALCMGAIFIYRGCFIPSSSMLKWV